MPAKKTSKNAIEQEILNRKVTRSARIRKTMFDAILECDSSLPEAMRLTDDNQANLSVAFKDLYEASLLRQRSNDLFDKVSLFFQEL